MAGVAVLAVLAVAAEGLGLLLLVPILQLMGLVEAGTGAPAWAGVPSIGLEGALAVYVLLVAAGAMVVAARSTAVAALRSDFADDLRRRLHRGLTGMEWRAFSQLRGADAQHALTMETARAVNGVDFLLRMAGWTVEIPVLLAVALRLSPALTGASLALGGVCLVLSRPLNRRSHALGQQLGVTWKALQGDISDDLAGMRVIRGFGLETLRRRCFEGRMADVRAATLAHQRSSSLGRAALQAFAAAAAALSVWFAVRVLAMGLADTLVLMMAFARLLAASLRIQDAWRTVLHALPAYAAVQGMLARCRAAAEPDLDADDAPPMAPPVRGLTLERVTFGYGADGPAVLRGIDAQVSMHAVTAVVGPSGAGKSTLADLLLGLSEPDTGRILVDGRPLSGALRRAWRRRVGYVPQEAFLFHDTVRANLLMACPQASDAALWAVLEQVAAADFVRALPQGLDTMVGDRGGWLSGGQRQRLALARALLAGPDLLILDEATSALDSESEGRVLDALEALRGRLAVVVIAHRPSTVRSADHVIVLDAGRVAATGPWADVSATAKPILDRLTMG
ncbi:ABC transporter ATP-binding protein [Azospirillum sp. sgz301742]